MMNIAILGSTGSIGRQTLEVISRYPDHFRVVALAANGQVDRLLEQCLCHAPRYAVLQDPLAAEKLRQVLHDKASSTEVLVGLASLEKVASLEEVDCVVAAIVGMAGLLPTLAAVRAGKKILLANKESLVAGGEFFINETQKSGAILLPVDSEHNAIFQCLPEDKKVNGHIDRIILTASGGPFRELPLECLSDVTPEQAAAHPRWNMGRKVSIDSATLMNKALEVIEARWLFDIPPEKIEVLIHPQSIIHSMVEYNDGSTLAQMSYPDMRTPIAHALAWPQRMQAGVKRLDLVEVKKLSFEAVDPMRYPCLQWGYHVIEKGGTTGAILNAANEIAVESFCNGDINFTDIPIAVEHVIRSVDSHEANTLDIILEDDRRARVVAKQTITKMRKVLHDF